MSKKDSPIWPYPVSQFTCHRCGNCCRGDGYVELSSSDIETISAHLNLQPDVFLDRYCKYDTASKAWHLVDQDDEEQSCIFLTRENTCEINDAKPQQCRDFPTKWRPSNILDFCEGWRAAAGLPPTDKRTMS